MNGFFSCPLYEISSVGRGGVGMPGTSVGTTDRVYTSA